MFSKPLCFWSLHFVISMFHVSFLCVLCSDSKADCPNSFIHSNHLADIKKDCQINGITMNKGLLWHLICRRQIMSFVQCRNAHMGVCASYKTRRLASFGIFDTFYSKDKKPETKQQQGWETNSNAFKPKDHFANEAASISSHVYFRQWDILLLPSWTTISSARGKFWLCSFSRGGQQRRNYSMLPQI